MPISKIERTLGWRPVVYGGGAAAVVLSALLTWANLSAPLNSRQPVPSPDGKYFAYFDPIEVLPPVPGGPIELIISKISGQEVARFSLSAETISWSNAGDLAVVNSNRSRAVLIANSDGRFLRVEDFIFSHATPRWSTDGTKIAFVQGESDSVGISIYDFLQTRAAILPFPSRTRLEAPLPLFWSPGSRLLYFLNGAGPRVVLERVDIQSGELQPLATGDQSWRLSPMDQPQLSPDGTRIFLPLPLNSVIDAQTGKTVWTCPAAGKVEWGLWSADSHQIYYSRGDGSGVTVAHDLTNSTDHLVLDHAEPGGFFSADSESYFYRDPQSRLTFDARQSLRNWLKTEWGWQQEGVASRSRTALGRVRLEPREQTRDGLIIMSRDQYMRVRYGLYDPQSRTFAAFVFPTDGEDLFRSARSQTLTLVSILLYVALASYILMRAPHNSPARALYMLSLILMVLFASLSDLDGVTDFWHEVPWTLGGAILTAKLMTITGSGLAFLQGRLICRTIALALLPPAILHFEFVFPEENQFLARRKKLKLLLYAAAFLPLAGASWAFNRTGETADTFLILMLLYYIAGIVIALSTLFALFHHHRHPPERHARIRIRRLMLVLAVPMAALAGRELLHIFLTWLE
ncbi:MAG TPA: hypothetical protein VKV95_03110 [Terriglobia bacterium]|nr:hypothetical protein [Terriglobia bacterium]